MAGSSGAMHAQAPKGGAGPASGGQVGSAAFAFVVGTNDADTILGGDGPDLVDGRGGRDTASGAGGNDAVIGGTGDDSLAGDGGLVYPGSAFLSGDDVLFGGAGNDTIYGDGFFFSSQGSQAASNVLFGGPGDDYLRGGYGDDTIVGGSGNDLIFGLGELAFPFAPTPTSYAVARENDRGDLLLGGAGDDTINGGGGGDTIYGGSGDDSINGDVANDTMAGGPGADIFVIRQSPTTGTDPTGRGEGNRDVVLDFQTGVDVLDLSLSGFGVRWEYEEQADRTIVYYTGRNGQEVEIELRGVRDLSADDIIL